jgi:predicted Na+-dependent transporter
LIEFFLILILKSRSIIGFVSLTICMFLEVLIFPDLIRSAPLNVFILVLTLPLISLSLGYLSASVCRLQHYVRRTIAIEVVIQNVGEALIVISLSFPFEVYFFLNLWKLFFNLSKVLFYALIDLPFLSFIFQWIFFLTL